MSNDIVDILAQIEKSINMFFQTMDDQHLMDAIALSRKTRKAIENGDVRSGSGSPDRANH